MPSDDSPRMVRRPRYLPFLLTGFVVGVVATALLVALAPAGIENPRRLALYLGILLGGVGALLGGALAVWLERDEH
ncbi:MAG: hypothetical protein QOE19_1882 [Actinomycetota bacterium]|nr:hypothetical protein [Actinomycetota bacterium]